MGQSALGCMDKLSHTVIHVRTEECCDTQVDMEASLFYRLGVTGSVHV